jgi:hypothetical protein
VRSRITTFAGSRFAAATRFPSGESAMFRVVERVPVEDDEASRPPLHHEDQVLPPHRTRDLPGAFGLLPSTRRDVAPLPGDVLDRFSKKRRERAGVVRIERLLEALHLRGGESLENDLDELVVRPPGEDVGKQRGGIAPVTPITVAGGAMLRVEACSVLGSAPRGKSERGGKAGDRKARSFLRHRSGRPAGGYSALPESERCLPAPAGSCQTASLGWSRCSR